MRFTATIIALSSFALEPAIVTSFHAGVTTQSRRTLKPLNLEFNDDNIPSHTHDEVSPSHHQSRRSFFSSTIAPSSLALSLLLPLPSHAGIDVSGLRSEGGGGNPAIASQLKSFDGSASSRVREIREATAGTSSGATPAAPMAAVDYRSASGPAATWALAVGVPSLRRSSVLFSRLDARVDAPPSSKSERRSVSISFDVPTDWLALDRASGAIQYVDQRNGDKVYVLRAPLPEGETVESVPKGFFSEVIFDSRGSIARSGTVIEGGRVSRSQVLNEGGVMHRKLLLKYDVVTGSGVQTVERRGLVDAYQVEGDVYMLMTSSNAVKFDAKGIERETVDNIVNSFRLDF
mmetsp:Transcript_61300/g.72797  ORF Transcript_61300/g.72797 Transcript_61300/m.72797 type:complete len:347 (+) Transcript_61300:167-1207(+)|eukprot:CAMPEP_0172512080 /NCGR_PEP_ID=MMETSP1066-20121228/241547_1 /TAXON_ID=671091 /ORGANISM="Coscinodiscus wailesii, Strain CCMP2513" /LENGTH=346 /DNA_ID=CAMNT_0013291717 /DNA_START=105 /DNA_END=1145 /DNA_ORIENTATION=+